MLSNQTTSKKALIVIDVQNDYFSDGQFPLANVDATLLNIESAIVRAQKNGIAVILIQHIANAPAGQAPFFNKDSEGVKLHARISAAAPEAPIVQKAYADSFYQTSLDSELSTLEVDQIYLCGMMTQNCVNHTALSKAAHQYDVTILADCCTTVSSILHNIALRAVATSVNVAELDAVLPQ